MEAAARKQESKSVLTVIRNDIRKPLWMRYMEENGSESIMDLDTIVCDEFRIETEMLFKQTRKTAIKDARFAYLYFLHKRFKVPSMAVERITGWNHASVLHACKKVKHFCETEYWYRKHIEQIRNVILHSIIRIPDDPMHNEGGYVLCYQNERVVTRRVEDSESNG